MTHVWYASYGSNLHADRFAYYLAGGRPPGAAVACPGCRDPRPPRADSAITAPGGIYFAGESPTWGGGVAFLDPELPGRAALRAYLVTAAQFADVVAQEMHRPPGADLDPSEAVRTGEQRLGPGRYETLLCLGHRGGVPVLTFTSPRGTRCSDGTAPLNTPAAAYLRMLGRGLAAAHGWPADRVADYLRGRPGAASWGRDALRGLLDGAVTSAHEHR